LYKNFKETKDKQKRTDILISNRISFDFSEEIKTLLEVSSSAKEVRFMYLKYKLILIYKNILDTI